MYRPFFLACLCSAAMTIGIVWAGCAASDAMAQARPVALADAHSAPSMLHYVQAGRYFTPNTDAMGRPCKRTAQARAYYSDVSAYAWDGSALGAQRRNARTLLTYWHRPGSAGAVTYDGLTFHNDTYAPVLVAGWCG